MPISLPWPRSLSSRLVAVATLLTLVGTMVLTLRNHADMQSLLTRHGFDWLERTTTLYSGRIADAFDDIRIEGERATHYPPIGGLIRSTTAPNGIDPLDGSRQEEWRKRLEVLFASVMSARPYITQMRFVGVADQWREIVRVDQAEGGTVATLPHLLQSKEGRPYLARLASDPATDSYFAPLSLNFDHGRVDDTVTLRAVHPVHTLDGTLFGAVIINSDFEALLHSAEPDVDPGLDVTILTDHGDYLTFRHDTPRPVFHFGATRLANPAPPWTDGTGTFETLLSDRLLRGAAIPVADLPFDLRIVTSVAEDHLLAPATADLRRNALISLSIIALTSLAIFVLSRHMTRPLVALHNAVTQRRDATDPITVPPTGPDEIGHLARSFTDMANRLIRDTGRLDAILSHAADGIVTIGETGLIEEVNQAVLDIFGYDDREELVGRPITDLMSQADALRHPDHIATTTLAPGQATRMGQGREFTALRQDGQEVPVQVALSCTAYEGARHFIGIIRDVTEARRAREQREALIAALERSNEELDQFAYIASHDLKAPLRVIDNASRWLAEDLEPHLTEDTQESLDLLQNRVGRMERLLDDLLEHSRIGRSHTTDEVVPARQLIADVIGLCHVPYGFRVELGPGFGDQPLPRMPLTTILLNLVGNAIKHHDTPNGEVRITLVDQGPDWQFRVTDDGPGIPPQYHEKVYQLFQTLRPRDQVESSGMGLAIVQKHVRLGGGRIDLISDGERGTTFVVTWPKPDITDQRRTA